MKLRVRVWRSIAVAVALVMVAVVVAPPAARADVLPDRTDRVVGLARLWANAKFFHPYLAYKDIDWDAALIAAIPRAEAAMTIAEYRAALQGMLEALGDPATRMEASAAPQQTAPAASQQAASAATQQAAPAAASASTQQAAPAASQPAAQAPPPPAKVAPSDWLSTPAPGVVAARIAGLAAERDFMGSRAKAAALIAAVTKAKAQVLVIDMRAPGTDPAYVAAALDQLRGVLPGIDEWPQQRWLQHRGFRSQDGHWAAATPRRS